MMLVHLTLSRYINFKFTLGLRIWSKIKSSNNRWKKPNYRRFLCTKKFTLYNSLVSFSQQYQPAIFHWLLRDSKSPRVSKTLLNILAVVSNAVIWMVSFLPLISNSLSTFPWSWGQFRVHLLHSVIHWHSCSTTFSVFWQGLNIF